MAVVTTDRFFLFLTFLVATFPHLHAADGDCGKSEHPTIRIQACPKAVFHPANVNVPGFYRWEVGVDEYQQKYYVCKVNLTGTILLGKGYTANRNVNGVWLGEICWVAANGTEIMVTQSDKIQYLMLRSGQPFPFTWVNIKLLDCFPKFIQARLSIRTGPLPNSPKQYIGRYNRELDEGLQIGIPGPINENNTEVIVGTYAGQIEEIPDYQIPICV